MRDTFKVALLQMRVVGGDKQRNLQHAAELVAEAAANDVDLVLLPEAMNLGWTHPSSRQQADPIPAGETCRALCDMARSHGIFVCAGLVEQAEDRVFNSAVIIDRQGEVILLHRKLNELTIGHEYYAEGDRLNVCETELGTLGLMICADAFAQDQVLGRALGYMGADVILSPSAWAVPANHDNRVEPYGQLWRELVRAGGESVLAMDLGGEQCRLDRGRAVGRLQVHRLLAGGRSRWPRNPAWSVRRGRRDHLVRRRPSRPASRADQSGQNTGSSHSRRLCQ